jgi:hypothetical protein
MALKLPDRNLNPEFLNKKTGVSTTKSNKWVPETVKKIMFLGSEVRPVRAADNLTAIYEPIV